MKKWVGLILLALLGMVVGSSVRAQEGGRFGPQPIAVTTESHWSQRGAVSFAVNTDKTYRNGMPAGNFRQVLVALPGLATIELTRSAATVDLAFKWEKGGYDRGIHVNLVELPGPETYYFQFSWDAERGLMEGYMNSVPLCLSGTKYQPWKVDGEAGEPLVGEGPNHVVDLRVAGAYRTAEELATAVPREMQGKHKELLGYLAPPPAMDIAQRKGELLYQTGFNNPDSVKDWRMEGPGKMAFNGGVMELQTDATQVRPNNPGHFVYWCPKDFPDRFVAEWDFEARSFYGLAIVFLAAHPVKGGDGGDIFDPALPVRNGVFGQYTNGAIASYHISYFANLSLYQTGRPCSNLRKNVGSMATAQGPVAILPGTKGFQHMRLIKDGPHIQLQANDKVSIDWTDDDTVRYGPAYHNGKIALRQMNETVGAYRDFRVWALTEK